MSDTLSLMTKTSRKRLRKPGGVFIACVWGLVLAGPAPAQNPGTEAPAEHSTPAAATGPVRLDAQYPYPPLEPAVSEVHGVRVEDWGYRFTRPGAPDNCMLIQARIKNETGQPKSALLVVGLEHAERWVFPSPVWFRVDMRVVDLGADEAKTVTVTFPELQSIHIGVKSKFYIPRVILRDPAEFHDDSNAFDGVKILEWNYTMVARPRGPRPAKFSALLRNFDGKAKKVTLRAELVPKSDAPDYEGPPEGFTEDATVEIEKDRDTALVTIPIVSVSGISRIAADRTFEPGLYIIAVEPR